MSIGAPGSGAGTGVSAAAGCAAAVPGIPVRPPRLFAGVLALAVVLDLAWPLPLLGPGPRLAGMIVGAGLGLAGAGLMVAAMGRFRRHGTAVETWKPSTALVTDGAYRFSRNPIYVALHLLYAGAVFGLDNGWAAALLIPLAAVMRYVVVAREERYLAARFGEDYRAYRVAVRRWL